MLGVFVLAFFVKRVGGTAAFAGVVVGHQAETVEDGFASKCEHVFRDVLVLRIHDELGHVFR